MFQALEMNWSPPFTRPLHAQNGKMRILTPTQMLIAIMVPIFATTTKIAGNLDQEDFLKVNCLAEYLPLWFTQPFNEIRVGFMPFWIILSPLPPCGASFGIRKVVMRFFCDLSLLLLDLVDNYKMFVSFYSNTNRVGPFEFLEARNRVTVRK